MSYPKEGEEPSGWGQDMEDLVGHATHTPAAPRSKFSGYSEAYYLSKASFGSFDWACAKVAVQQEDAERLGMDDQGRNP